MLNFLCIFQKPKLETLLDVKPTLKSYVEFKEALGKRESSGNYSAKNSLGYLGKYQFGLCRLSDFGLCKRKEGTKGYANSSFDWVSPYSEALFLANTKLQDAVFDSHVLALKGVIENKFKAKLDREICGHKLDLSGAIGCAHLLGIGGLKNFINGQVGSDGYGTKATDYIDLFYGYMILVALDFDSLNKFME
jgi:hypothetical protein